ncbi:MAG TPA: MarR family transcriptional regulator [Gaiellaceae bacterium]|nr:MarR family transcriptional regulator [Gaiellaceae bacterium]
MNAPTLKQPTRPPRELVKSPSFLLKRLGLAIKDRTMAAFEERGANPYQHGILCSLSESRAETQSQIADALGYDRSWLVGLLDELEAEGLIERKADPADRRRNVVTLKPEGEARLLEFRELTKQVEDEFLAPLDKAERRQLHELLLKLAEHHDPRYGK